MSISTVREHPILFSVPMVRAILEGKKTQTRRIIKPQPQGDLLKMLGHYAVFSDKHVLSCPYGQPRDHLWVRETWTENDRGQNITKREWEDIYQLLDLDTFCTEFGLPDASPRTAKWHPSIFMPRDHSRVLLEIVEIRAERLQAITEDDAIAEGVTDKAYPAGDYDGGYVEHELGTWIGGYMALWDSINVKRGYSWQSNPWVWVVTFRALLNEQAGE